MREAWSANRIVRRRPVGRLFRVPPVYTLYRLRPGLRGREPRALRCRCPGVTQRPGPRARPPLERRTPFLEGLYFLKSSHLFVGSQLFALDPSCAYVDRGALRMCMYTRPGEAVYTICGILEIS